MFCLVVCTEINAVEFFKLIETSICFYELPYSRTFFALNKHEQDQLRWPKVVLSTAFLCRASGALEQPVVLAP